MSISITVLFIALLALIQFPMTVAVGLHRTRTDIHFMDGGDTDLMRRMRAHGNFTETVPITLLAMAAAENRWSAGGIALDRRAWCCCSVACCTMSPSGGTAGPSAGRSAWP